MPIYHLTLHAPLHVGEYLGVFREAILNRIPSDTLFAAIVTAWTRLGVDIPSRLAAFENEAGLPFTLTSAFPRAGNVRFYPPPPRFPPCAGFPPGDKTLKKLRWISDGVLKTLQAGQPPAKDPEKNLLDRKTLWLTDAEFSALQPLLQFDEAGELGLWREHIAPRVTVDRVANTSNLFFSGRLSFAENCGVWFAVRGRTDWVEEALNVLQDEGIGGLRSTGHGAFTWEKAADDLPPQSTDWGLSLSRFAPRNEVEVKALQNDNSAYALETIGGWCEDDAGHSWRRRSVRMVAEGALLPTSGLLGRAQDARPAGVGTWKPSNRPVWRAGFAFFIPAEKLVEVV